MLGTLSSQGILGGYDLSREFPELGNALLVCATEMRDAEDIDTYIAATSKILGVAA